MIQRVDTTGRTGRYTSIELDSNGYPHINYCREDEGGFVKYAFWTGINWDIQTIDTGSGITNGNLTITSLAIDTDDHPHIAYSKPPNNLHYAYWEGEQWIYHTECEMDGIYGSVGIALDSDNHPHIS